MPDLTHPWTQIALAFFLAGATLALGYSLVKYEWLLKAARSGSAGLSAHELLALSVSRRIRRGSGKRNAFCLVLIRWLGLSDTEALNDATRCLRGMVRRSDDVLWFAPDRIVVILDAPASQATHVVRRWRAASQNSETGELKLGASVVGISAYPDDGENAEELLAAAESRAEAMVGLARGGLLELDLELERSGADRTVAEPPLSPAEESMLDPLTGLLRADRMGRAARKFISNCRYRGRPVVVFHVDIDRLATLNERYGQEAGDAVVRACADTLSSAIRESDLLGRLNDDEFLAVLDCPLNTAEQVARRLIVSVRESPARLGEVRLPYAIRVGIAGIGGAVRPAHVLDAAAVAVRWARRMGPGTYVMYAPHMEHAQPEERPVEDVW